MVYILVIAILGVLGMLVCLAFFPELKLGRFKFQTFWMPPFVSAVILLASTLVKWDYFYGFLTSDSAINPLEILVLFLSMAFLSTVLDEAGFFSNLASKTVRFAGGSQLRVFIFLYLVTSVLTIFTSNDIIILTFTPFLIYFSKRAEVDPIPYLVGEFVAANSWSMLFLIGNPTNIYLGQSFGIDFAAYFLAMWPSALLGGVVSFAIMLALFYKKLKVPFATFSTLEIEPIKDKPLMWASIAALFVCLIMMMIANFFSIPLWLISAVAACALFLFSFVYVLFKKDRLPMLTNSIKRLPYTVVPFVLAMFVLVLGLKESGLTGKLGSALNGTDPVWSYGLSSFLAANLVNNIPMSVFYTEVVRDGMGSLRAMYASVIASNIGAFLSPVGALAGVMWMSILKNHDIKYTFADFLKYGALIALPTLIVALSGLYL
jgi:arsenical pump membrane protein